MRTLEEVDADIAETKRQIALGNAFNRRAARFDYILEGDRSGLDAIGQALNNAIERERQQKFQAEESEKQRKFQEAENAKQMALQLKNQDYDRTLDKARTLRDLGDAYAVYEDTKIKSGDDTLAMARARNMLQLQLDNAAHLGIPLDKLNEFNPNYKAPAPQKNETAPAIDVISGNQDINSVVNEFIRNVGKTKNRNELKEMKIPFENNSTTAEHFKKAQDAIDKQNKVFDARDAAARLLAEMKNQVNKKYSEAALEGISTKLRQTKEKSDKDKVLINGKQYDVIRTVVDDPNTGNKVLRLTDGNGNILKEYKIKGLTKGR
jgi:hypothetical protein